MIIMTLAYTQASGNETLINSYYDLLRNWCNYLVANTLTPTNQCVFPWLFLLQSWFPDDREWADYNILQNSLPVNNQTNLALKGIIAIAAMSKIASIVGNDADASQYNVSSVIHRITTGVHGC